MAFRNKQGSSGQVYSIDFHNMNDDDKKVFYAFLSQQQKLSAKKRVHVFNKAEAYRFFPPITVGDQVYHEIKLSHTIKYYQTRGAKTYYRVIANQDPSKEMKG